MRFVHLCVHLEASLCQGKVRPHTLLVVLLHVVSSPVHNHCTFQRIGWTNEVPSDLSTVQDCVRKEVERSSSNVKCVTLGLRSRKIAFLDASVTCLVADVVSEMGAQLQRDEQANLKMRGEMLYPLFEIRKKLRKW